MCSYSYLTVEQFLQVVFLANVVFCLKNYTGKQFFKLTF